MVLTLGTIQAQTAPLRITHDGYQHLQLTFTAAPLTARSIQADGQSFALLEMEGAQFSQKVGSANLPTYSALIEVPICQAFSIEVAEAQYDTIPLSSLGVDHQVMPLQPSRSKSDTSRHALVLDKKAYNTDAYQGVEMAMVEHVGMARDRNLARLQISPVRYNAVQGSIIVCRHAVVTVQYHGADSAATMQHFRRYHSPAFGTVGTLNSLYPKTIASAAPVRYLIVAHSMFRGQLDNFITWKQRKGFLTDIVYTDDPGVGSTTADISSYIHSQYTNATDAQPAPTYVLLVGDHEQIPAYTGTTSNEHITDLYFMTWTPGDNIPDCYYGRFSAQNISQLTPQIEKTLMYEQYTFANPSFLDRAVMVAGVDGGNAGDYGYTHADPAMDYAITHYVNGSQGFSSVNYFKNNTTIVPTATNVTIGSNNSSNSANVRNYYNQGAGWINYSAHGSATSWGTPNFTTTHAAAMTNTQKFGIMIGNCCLTNKFETATCLGESLLRKGNYCGAVGYIGGTNSTYWYEDFYWAVGLRTGSTIGPSMSMAYDATHQGNYDALCHTHGESRSQWIETQGAMVVNGNTIVEGSTSGLKLYYWEIYQLMGDPSLMPYLTQATSIPMTAPSVVMSGASSISVQAVPYAYVALTDTTTHSLIASAYANAAGQATLTITSPLAIGGYEIAASAQQYRTTFSPMSVVPPDNAYIISTITTNSVASGSTSWLSGIIANIGSQAAHNVVVRYSCSNPQVSVLTDSISIPFIPAHDTISIDSLVLIAANALMPDFTDFTIEAAGQWDSATVPSFVPNTLHAVAPQIAISYIGLSSNVLPSDTYNFDVQFTNQGHMPLPATAVSLHCPIWQAAVTATDTTSLALAVGASTTRHYQLAIDAHMPFNIIIPLVASLDAQVNMLGDTALLSVGLPNAETFEGMVYHLAGWTQGTYPWNITNSQSQEGFYSARSNASLTHNQTSEITLTHDFPMADSIRFYYKVSSEANYDKFKFYIDGIQQIEASGDVSWTRAAYPVEAGTHQFNFAYQKDISVNSGSDCVWIDQVTMPFAERAWTTEDDTICAGQQIVVNGQELNTHVAGHLYATDTTADTIRFLHFVVRNITADTMVTACDQYAFLDTTYTQTTDFNYLSSSATGCDTLYTCHLTIHPSSSVSTDSAACDSLILWGESYSLSGAYTSPLQINQYGCDSTATVHLTIHPSITDTIEAVDTHAPFNWNGEEYTTSGIYTQTFQTQYGCDSTVVLNLTILLGIDQGEGQTAIMLYPNPTQGVFHFSQPIESAVVYDAQGRQVLTLSNTDHADLGQLPAGIYTLRITTPEGCATRRLCIE